MKRILDFTVSLLGLVLLLPVFLVIATLIWRKSGFPIVFRQKRPGLHGKPFVIYKFRTMIDDRSTDHDTLRDVERLTPLGLFLRRTSLDELPELWNVLKGDMSLVGPRPLLMRYLPFYTDKEKKRHDVRPGITGLAQVSGRNLVEWGHRLALDVEYVHRQSMVLDVRILWLTLFKVLAGDGFAIDVSESMNNLDVERGENSGNQEDPTGLRAPDR